MAYKRPKTIATLLTNYKIQAHEDSVAIGGSYTSGKCLLRNRGGEGVMVKKTNLIKFKIINKKKMIAKTLVFMRQSAMSVMSSM